MNAALVTATSSIFGDLRESIAAQRELGIGVLDVKDAVFGKEVLDLDDEARERAAGIIINPAGYTFTSIAILDALKMFPGPIIELHISNIHRREAHYHKSYVSLAATAVIAGLGARGYATAIRSAIELVEG